MKQRNTNIGITGILLLLFAGFGCVNAVPESKEIEVPFTSQAPAGDWSQPWKDACEETSIYMVASFYAGDDIKREEAIKKIREILKTKNETFKVSKDESLATIAELIDELGLPWNARIVYDPTVDDLKKELSEGRPIIVPVYAPALGNPYYGGGVYYHVLVLTGYDDADDVFVVNDPGTKRGEGLRFKYDTFMGAIHDLNPKDLDAGKKAVLFTSAKSDLQLWFEGLSAE